MRMTKKFFVTLRGRRFGVETGRVHVENEPYLDRCILYFGWGTLRLHKFWRGDDNRAPHDHPWWFVTFPLQSYWEDVYKSGVFQKRSKVTAFNFFYRSAKYQHIVIGPKWSGARGKPFWTLVLSGHRSNSWGFWPEPGKFVSYKERDAE